MTTIDAGTAKLAGLQADMLQKILGGHITLSHLEWFNNLTLSQRNMLSGADLTKLGDPRFVYVKTIEVTVPEGYDHATRLDTYKVGHESEYYYYNLGLTDANFANASTKLTAGRKFGVKVFVIKSRVSSDDCLAQYERVNAVKVGAQGLTILCEQKKDELPKGKCYVSFDEKDNLPLIDGYHRVSGVYADAGGDFNFDLGNFELDWYDYYVLLAFCDLPEQPLDAQ